ncbi:MAG: AzlC family ABC transporter permease [Chloroflexi bacterium]|nr:AzlC family ABC transporter permease [Chloroflexota bacterium]
MNTTTRSQFFRGVRDLLPILLGVMPFGLIYGIAAVNAGIPPLQAFLMSSVVFSGSAQFAATQLIANGALASVVIFSIIVVNLRHVMYSATISPHFKGMTIGWKTFLSYLLTDEAFAMTVTRFNEEPEMPHKNWYFLGAGMALWVTWQVSTAVGVFAGGQVPANWSLDFTIALTFLALSVPSIRDRSTAVAAVVGGVAAVLLRGMPFQLGLVTAAILGIAAGYGVDRWTR